MKILWLNRYDPLSPKAGGAETFSFQICKRLVENGHQVVWLASKSDPTLSSGEKHAGMVIIRKGNKLSVIWHAFLHYQANKAQYDFVVDEVHAYPFFTKLYVKRSNRLVLVHEVAGPIWYYEAKFPFSYIGDLFEKLLYPTLYNRERFFTISASTQKSLINYGISKEQITILPMGLELNANPVKVDGKSATPQIVYSGGMRKMKRVEDQIAALKLVAKTFPQTKLYILGHKTGKYYQYLLDLVTKLRLTKNVVFTGYISNSEKYTLMGQSWLAVNTSVREGWGLAVSEPNYFGVPAIVYDVNGLRDVVEDKVTGLIIKPKVSELARAIELLIVDEELRLRLGQNAKKLVEKMSWDDTYQVFYQTITNNDK
jgi:glycosyltransferase involved in cell wall biosynthesis